MKNVRKALVILALVTCFSVIQSSFSELLFSQATDGKDRPAGETARKAAPAGVAAKSPDPYAKEVTKRGNVVIVSKSLADLVRKDNAIVLSHMTVRQRVDGSGKVASYEAVEVDKGSSVAKMGIQTGDQLVAVNGIPANDLTANKQSLEGKNRFQVDIRRKGRPVKLIFEIR
jgi:type II secretory pathway component PulC